MILKIIKYFKKNYVLILLLLILSIAAFLRLNRIEDYLTFLGDEGRDVLVVREILSGNFTLLGPRTSAADFYTGPIYYYMMAPFLYLANYNPVGPAIMVALLGIATVYLIFRFGREWFGTISALIAAGLYSISPLAITQSRTSWNPNPMPFFTLLILYLLYRAVLKSNLKLLLIAGFFYGIAFQLHYIEVFVGVIIVFFILFGNLIQSKKEVLFRVVKHYVFFGVGFILGLSPFLAFEVRHGFPNTRTVINFIINGDPKATDLTNTTFLQIIYDVFFRLFGRLILNFPTPEKFESYERSVLFIWSFAVILVGVGAIFALLKIKDKLVRLLLGFWLFFGIALFGFYHKPIYDYYFQFMFPLPFLLIGNLFSYMWDKTTVYKIAAILSVFIILVLNLSGYPFQYPPNKQYRQVELISKFILDKAGSKPFNFALLTLGNSDHAYRYIFEVNGMPPVEIENPQIDPVRKSVTDQLFIICEDPNCHPEGASLWEVAGFGRAEIAAEWPVSVLKVYKLVHYKEQ